MKKGKTYGGQMFKNTGVEANLKNISEIAEEYYKLCTIQQTNIKDITINSYCRNLTPILKYGYSKGYLPKVEITEIKTQKEMYTVYSDKQMQLLLTKPKQNDFVTIRNWTIVWVFASTAIRRNELIHH